MTTVEGSMVVNHGIDVVYEWSYFEIFLGEFDKSVNFSVELKSLKTKGENWTGPLKSELFLDGSIILTFGAEIRSFFGRDVLI